MNVVRLALPLTALAVGGCAVKAAADDSAQECSFEPGMYAAAVSNRYGDPETFGVQSPMSLEIDSAGELAFTLEFVDDFYAIDATVAAEGTIDGSCQSRALGFESESACGATVYLTDWSETRGAGYLIGSCYITDGSADDGHQDTFEATWSVP